MPTERLPVPLLSADSRYLSGYEAGRVFAAMLAGESPFRACLFSINDEQFLLFARACGYAVTWRRVSESHSEFVFTRHQEDPYETQTEP